MSIRLSKASKMPCLSWSTEARTHCPASLHLKGPKKGELVDACIGCYAAGGNYRFPNVRAPRLSNAQDWKRDAWEDDMVEALENETLFRWFDSGDCAWLALACKMYNVMQRTPHVKHWFPTRMHKFPKFRPVFARMRRLSNVVVRLSSDSVAGLTIRGATTSTIFSKRDQLPKLASVCGAYKRDGKCGPCRACWDKDTKLIAYPAHGKVMLGLIARQAA